MLFLLLMFSFGVSYSASAQVAKPGDKEEVIRVETDLIDVPIAVVGPDGMPVRGLKATNFVIYEDGKRQEIVDFSTTAEPFEVALLLDTSGSARGDLPLIQRAAQEFVASLRPGDRVAIIAYRTQRSETQAFALSDVIAPMTSDRRILKESLDALSTSNGTPFYDSLVQIVEQVFDEAAGEQFRGRRALVALTDGVDSTSAADFRTAKSGLEQSGIMSFFIKVDTRDFFEEGLLGDCQSATKFSAEQMRRYYRGVSSRAEKTSDFCKLGDFERLAISKKLYEIADAEMEELARLSGGKVFPVGDVGEARNAFKSVAGEIGTKYTIGYYSSNEKRDGTQRKIKVEVKGAPAGSKIRTREGYTAPRN